MTLQLGIFLAALCAVATNVGFLLKHRGACAAPAVSWTHPGRSAVGLFRSPWFALGMGVAFVGWIFHVGALALAPLSVVQAVLAGGLVLLTVIAERIFGLKVSARGWIGVGLTSLGLVLLSVTLPATGDSSSSYSLAAMIPFESALLALGILLVFAPRTGTRHGGLLLGAAAGLLFGVSDVAIKAMTGLVADAGLLGLVTPWLGTAMLASAIAFFAAARGLQTGEAVPVITMTSIAANISSITGGILVFGDPLAAQPLALVVQIAAFALIIAAGALLPAPRQVGAAPAAA